MVPPVTVGSDASVTHRQIQLHDLLSRRSASIGSPHVLCRHSGARRGSRVLSRCHKDNIMEALTSRCLDQAKGSRDLSPEMWLTFGGRYLQQQRAVVLLLHPSPVRATKSLSALLPVPECGINTLLHSEDAAPQALRSKPHYDGGHL